MNYSTNKYLMVIPLLAVCFYLTGCSVGEQQIQDAPYKMVDTDIWTASNMPGPFWLDNHRIIFATTETLTPSPHTQWVIWDTQTRQLQRTQLTNVQCVREGNILYWEKDPETGKIKYYRGLLDKLEEHPAPQSNMRIDTSYDCDWVSEKSYGRPGLYTEGKFKLLGEDYIEILEPRTAWAKYEKKIKRQRGVQDTNDSKSKGKAIYRTGTSTKTEVPTLFWWKYSEFINAYIFSGYYDPSDPETRSFWILQRNGDLKEIPYPKMMLVGRNYVFPVKEGYVVHYNGGPLTEKANTRGLYLINEQNQVQRLAIGPLDGTAISPDGCKVAFIHTRSVKENHSPIKSYRTIKYINFCQESTVP